MTKLSWILYLIEVIHKVSNITFLIFIGVIIITVIYTIAISVDDYREIWRVKKYTKIIAITLSISGAVLLILPSKTTMMNMLAIEVTNYSINETELGSKIVDISELGLELLHTRLKDMKEEKKKKKVKENK